MRDKQNLETCRICHPDQTIPKQYGMLLKNLLVEMRDFRDKHYDNKWSNTSNNASFYQLLKCLLEDCSYFNKENWNCNHQFMNQYFQKVLKISQNVLENLSQQLFVTITKRRYQFQIIKTLTKNMPKTIISSPSKHDKNKNHKLSRTSLRVQKVQNTKKKLFTETKQKRTEKTSEQEQINSILLPEIKEQQIYGPDLYSGVPNFLYQPQYNHFASESASKGASEFPFLSHDGGVDWKKIKQSQ